MGITSGHPIAVFAGHVTFDRFGDELLPGGCVYYASHVWRGLGGNARIVTAVGNDFNYHAAFEGIDAHVIHSDQTSVFTNLYPEDGRRIQYLEGMAAPVEPESVPASWRNADVLFLGPVIGEVDLKAWGRWSKPQLTALGVQGFLRYAGPTHPNGRRRVQPKAWLPTPRMLQDIDVACLSDEDLEGQGDLLDRLVDAIPLVALTRKRRGCDLYHDGRKRWVGIYPSCTIDPTGAGDSFAAGLLYGLTLGLDAFRACCLGAAAASIIIEGIGGTQFKRMDQASQRASTIDELGEHSLLKS